MRRFGPPEPLRSHMMMMGAGPSGGGGVPWSPLALSPLIWLDATQLGLDDGDPVASFTDLSGNGNHFVQATPANQPIFRTSGINGIASVQSDGVDDNMTCGGIGAQTTWWAFLVAQQTAINTGENTFWAIADYPSSTLYKLLEKSSGAHGVAGIYMNANPVMPGFSAPNIAGITFSALIRGSDTGSVSNFDDGATGSGVANCSRADDLMRLFGRGNGNYAPAYGGELVFGEGTLSTENEDLLWAYANSKWGTSIP